MNKFSVFASHFQLCTSPSLGNTSYDVSVFIGVCSLDKPGQRLCQQAKWHIVSFWVLPTVLELPSSPPEIQTEVAQDFKLLGLRT